MVWSLPKGRIPVRLIFTMFFLALMSPGLVYGADFKKGAQAYRAADYATARAEWVPLAEAGHTRAMNNVALMYKKGLGLPVDLEKAFFYYKKSADQGFLLAEFNLAGMYSTGKGTPKDPKKAAFWMLKAANGNMGRAQVVLGNWYAKGFGVPKDETQALTWYMIAFKNSKGKFNKKVRGIVSKFQTKLKPMEVNEALRSAQSFKPN